MAIFESKHDAALPLVTQLMQVDLEDDAEVSRFWWRVVENTQQNFSQESSPSVSDRVFAGVCHYIQDIVLSLHENHTVPLGRLLALRMQTSFDTGFFPKRSALEVLAVVDVARGAAMGDEREEQYIPLDDFVWTRDPQNVPPSQLVTMELGTLMGELWHKRARLEKCPECENVFVARKQGVVFCSHRCANAAGTRRRRAKNAEKKVAAA